MLGDHLIPALSPFGRVRFQLIRAVSQGERALAKKRHAREEGFQHGDLVAAPVRYCWYRETYAVSCGSHIGPWSIRPASRQLPPEPPRTDAHEHARQRDQREHVRVDDVEAGPLDEHA